MYSSKIFEDNPEALCAILLLEYTTKTIFLTGRAGTGKSTLLREVVELFQGDVLILASTGIAAQNANGNTIHSVMKFPFHLMRPDNSYLKDVKLSPEQELKLVKAKAIIFDEISTINAATLDCVDVKLRQVCKSIRPFGGKKILLVGDPFQLSPVVKSDADKEVLSYYKSKYFFDSTVFKALNPITIELNRNYRQDDEVFLNLLNNLRENRNVMASIEELNKHCYWEKIELEETQLLPSIMLTFTNKDAANINEQMLAHIQEKEWTFEAEISGHIETRDIIAERLLRIKKGARIMMVKNHPLGEYVNGTLGYIKEVSDDAVSIKTDDRRIIEVQKADWTNEHIAKVKKDGNTLAVRKVIGRFTQFPLKLAWAITVHKSQGLTFDNVYLYNVSRVFAAAQVYVALSRCRTLKGLSTCYAHL